MISFKNPGLLVSFVFDQLVYSVPAALLLIVTLCYLKSSWFLSILIC